MVAYSIWDAGEKFESYIFYFGCSSDGRTKDCGSFRRGFESRQPSKVRLKHHEGKHSRYAPLKKKCGISSAGRAVALQAIGRQFEPVIPHSRRLPNR